MRREYVDGAFGQIHVQHDPSAGQPVVLLHQAIMASGQFDAVFPHLIARGLRPIAIDMPGFGLSDAPPRQPVIADYARAVAPVLDALGLSRAVIAGHHTGALAATEFALAHPERVRAVVLHGAMVISAEDRAAMIQALCEPERAFRARPEGAHFVEVARLRESLAAGSIAPDRITDYVIQAMQAYRQGAYGFGHAAALAYDHAEPLQRLRGPALLVTNTGDLSHPGALAARALRPDFAWAQLPGGGIDICDQDPKGWAQAIADFIATVDA
jgi:haloalkane dehalogenase